MNRFQTSLLVMVVLLSFLCRPGLAATTGDLTYFTENYPPYNFYRDGRITGISVEVLKLVWKEMGVEPQEINLVPWARGYYSLQNEAGTCLFSTSRTPRREKMFKWACPLVEGDRFVLIAKKSRQLEIDSIEEANQYRVGTIRNDVAEQLFLSLGGDENNVESVGKMIYNLKKLESERIDLLAYGEGSTYAFMDDNGFDRNLYETVFLLAETPLCLAFHRSTPEEVVAGFQEALETVRQTEAYQEILAEFEQ